MNLVVINHGGVQNYLFEAPEGVVLKKGDTVLVKNKKGEVLATCGCDSFEASKNVAVSLSQVFGGKMPLAKVIGKYTLERFPTPNEEVADGEEV